MNDTMTLANDVPETGRLAGRVWRPDRAGPALVKLRAGRVIDITRPGLATMRDLLESSDPAAVFDAADGEDLGPLADLARFGTPPDQAHMLAPCDLQALKACGVTFASSMLERVIEERALGDPARAESTRKRITSVLGDNVFSVTPGSAKAEEVKQVLIAENLWSQYLEVGIGPMAEVFTKAQPMSAVGWGAGIGIHPASVWNNPEPEIVLAVSSTGRIVGATLGNDVNLRDIEGRSALLLGKAKDNNASCAIGPFVRLFDDTFGLDEIRRAELELTVRGPEGYVLNGRSSMSAISRDPLDLVAQTINENHQYPDGFMLFLGTLFAPTEDRDTPGEGFTHKSGDTVTIAEPCLGALRNTVALSSECPPWTFGAAALMRNLAERKLL
jgi:fumarylacetoacetate (FAA) hydrolase family protein